MENATVRLDPSLASRPSPHAPAFAASVGLVALVILSGLAGCTFETRNKISRSIQNWTGTDGVVDVFSDGKVMYRFIGVEKLTTADATGGDEARPYRFAYGVFDLNQNYKADPGEKQIYFEVGSTGGSYIFYENPTTP